MIKVADPADFDAAVAAHVDDKHLYVLVSGEKDEAGKSWCTMAVTAWRECLALSCFIHLAACAAGHLIDRMVNISAHESSVERIFHWKAYFPCCIEQVPGLRVGGARD